MAQKRTDEGFFYGIDGPWVAHTEYEASIYQPKIDVNGNKVLDKNNKEILANVKAYKLLQNLIKSPICQVWLTHGRAKLLCLNLADINSNAIHINVEEVLFLSLSYKGKLV